MTLVDDHGRLFGKWNIVDALIGVVLLGLIPLLYGGYALFRAQPASLVAVEPARMQGPAEGEITIRGNNLRPYMRVSIDAHQGRSFMFVDTTRAVVKIADIPPGVYDVILYDNAQERARLPKAFEVVAAPVARTELDVIGSFTAITPQVAAQIKQGLQIAGLGEVLQVGTPQPSATRASVGPAEMVTAPSGPAVNLAAVIHASCVLVPRSGGVTCMALDNALTRDIVLSVPLAGGNAMFQIDQVRVAGAPANATVRARMSGERAVIEQIRRGDRDVERNNEFAAGAEIVSTSTIARAGTSVIVSAQPLPGSTPMITAGDIASMEVVIRMPGQQTVQGWSYRGQIMKGGRPFVFHGPEYEVSGTVLSITTK